MGAITHGSFAPGQLLRATVIDLFFNCLATATRMNACPIFAKKVQLPYRVQLFSSDIGNSLQLQVGFQVEKTSLVSSLVAETAK